ncbi:MAG: MBL fold metallo-hydrolase [Peptococcaceae bacterium]|jgi:glyoxylase-like metal-dependent hydrolase (beta-lactamase superfamily II)|nr:MBL fold metallo-hydrolase [Peptococcaceae bacterium]
MPGPPQQKVVTAMLQQITGNFHFVERGWLSANHFVYNGRRRMLIDTGYQTHLGQTLDLIRQTGLDPRSVDLIVSTHGHCDHVGGNRFIQELSGCEIAMHAIDRRFIEARDDYHTWWSYYDQQADFFPVHRSLADGENIDLDDLTLEVLHVPGHAAGQIALYCPKFRFLIAADALWQGDFGVLTPAVDGPAAPLLQQSTLDRLAALPLAVIYPGHGPVIRDSRLAIDRCRRRIERFLAEPAAMARDQVKKIILYALLMKEGCHEADFFPYLMTTPWYPQTVDLFFPQRYRELYDDVMAELVRRNLVIRSGQRLAAALRA